MIFQDISHFSNTGDYLALLNGALIVECVVIFLSMHGLIRSKVLKYWYKTYGLAAVLADVCIVMIGFIITRFLYPFLFSAFNLVYFILLALVVQVVHDLSFYAFFSALPRGFNGMMDTFKEYGKEMGGYAIVGDSNIILFSCLAASFMAGQSLNTNLIYLIVNLYFIPYLIYT
jgi:hypothetical protein